MKTKILNLKKWFLENNLVEENEYLEKYLLLLSLNLNTEALKNVTQKHHVIPVIYYKHSSSIKTSNRSRSVYEQLANSDKNNFLINLKYSDHLLAHCYLALCAKQQWFKFANANMITVISKHTDPENFIQLKSLEAYQQAYTLSCQLKASRTLSEEHKRKIGEAHRTENISAEYREKLSEANRNRVWTTEARDHQSTALKQSEKFQSFIQTRNRQNPPAKGLIWVTNGDITTRINPDKLSEYIALGYCRGKKATIQIHKGKEEIIINTKDWPRFKDSGWKKYWKKSKNK